MRLGEVMTTPIVIFDPFAGDFLLMGMTRIVGSGGEEFAWNTKH
jgi:hypothetical protein